MAQAGQLRRTMGSASGTGDQRYSGNTQKSSGKRDSGLRSTIGKVMNKDGSADNGRNVLQGPFYGVRSSQNRISSFFAVDFKSNS